MELKLAMLTSGNLNFFDFFFHYFLLFVTSFKSFLHETKTQALFFN